MSERLAKHQAAHPALSARSIVTPAVSPGVSPWSGRLLAVAVSRRSVICWQSVVVVVVVVAGPSLVGFVVLFCVFFVFSFFELRQATLPHPVRSSRGQHFEPSLNFDDGRTWTSCKLDRPRQTRRHRAQLTSCCVRSTIASLLRTADCKNSD